MLGEEFIGVKNVTVFAGGYTKKILVVNKFVLNVLHVTCTFYCHFYV